MAPDTPRLPMGIRMTEGGTAHGDECVCCRRRFSRRYYTFDGGGPYCGEHVPTTQPQHG